MKRRRFLQQTAQKTAWLGAASLVTTVGAHSWLWQSKAQAATMPRLIVVMLRGAADGLNIVVPYQETEYYEARPSIAIAKPGENDGVLDLDGRFGLHPALAPLMPEWEAGRLAFVHASGSPTETRSHFQAQDYLENGTPGNAATHTGWLNRLLAVLPDGPPTQAVNMGTGGTLPLILSGAESVANLGVNGAGNPAFSADQGGLQTAFDRLYAGDDKVARIYQSGRQSRDTLMQELAEEGMEASRGAPTPERFANTTRSLAQLMKGNAGTQIAFLELGGWDTHVNERGVLARQLDPLGNGLATLAEELGDLYQDTTIVVMSEFGRTIAENGNGGTDHGYGNAMWILGGSVRGRQIYGEWPGLSEANQHESRDLAITTDFRDVMASLLDQQFGLGREAIAQVFPNYRPQNRITLL
ncbi:MAG: DUF1501 domain-containing protein [Phormidesmis sp.]